MHKKSNIPLTFGKDAKIDLHAIDALITKIDLSLNGRAVTMATHASRYILDTSKIYNMEWTADFVKTELCVYIKSEYDSRSGNYRWRLFAKQVSVKSKS